MTGQIGHNTDAGKQLKGYIAQVEDLREQIGELKADEKAVFEAARSAGFDPKAMRAVVKRRAEDADARDKRAAFDETVDLYLHALGDLPLFDHADADDGAEADAEAAE